MMEHILSLMLLVPLIGGVTCLLVTAQTARNVALAATLIDLALGVVLWCNFDVGGARWQFQESVPLFQGFAWKLGIDGIALLLIDWRSGLVLVVAAVPLYFLMRWFYVNSQRAYRESRVVSAKVIVKFVETMTGIRAVKAFRKGNQLCRSALRRQNQ